MSTRKIQLFCALSILLLACGSDRQNERIDPQKDAGVPDAEPNDASLDAGAPACYEWQERSGVICVNRAVPAVFQSTHSILGRSCATHCMAEQATCASGCWSTSNTASHEYYRGTRINIGTDSCGYRPEATTTYGSVDYTYSQTTCCCEAMVSRVEGELDAIRNCRTVCSTDGMVCVEDVEWGSYDHGGIFADYGTTSVSGSCSYVPQRRYGSDLLPLLRYFCACR